jgi:hypothetical protein
MNRVPGITCQGSAKIKDLKRAADKFLTVAASCIHEVALIAEC